MKHRPFNYRLIELRATYRDTEHPHGLTEHALAEAINRQQVILSVTAEHITQWQINKDLEMLNPHHVSGALLFAALQEVLIDQNENIPEQEKAVTRNSLAAALQLSLRNAGRSSGLTRIGEGQTFAAALIRLRQGCDLSEAQLCERVNRRLGEYRDSTKAVMVEDIVAYQVGEREPDLITLARMNGALGLSGEEGLKTLEVQRGPNSGLHNPQEKQDELQAQFKVEIAAPLRAMAESVAPTRDQWEVIRQRLLYSQTIRQGPLMHGGSKNSSVTAMRTVERKIADVEANFSKLTTDASLAAQRQTLYARWREMQREFSAARDIANELKSGEARR